MDTKADDPAHLLDDDGRVATDLPCIKCGYNLRTLAEDALCPECARPVVDALHAQYLRNAPAEWVTTLTDGARGLTFFFAYVLAAPVIVTPLMAINSDTIKGIAVIVGGAGLVLALIAGLAGLLSITERNPALTGCPEGLTARRVVRWLFLPVAFAILSFCGGLSTSSVAGFPRGAFGVCVTAVVAGLSLTLCHHVRDIAQLIPRPDLARFARYQSWLLALVFIPLVAGALLGIAGSGPIPLIAKALILLAGFGAIPAAIAGFVLLLRLDRALAKTDRAAGRRGAA